MMEQKETLDLKINDYVLSPYHDDLFIIISILLKEGEKCFIKLQSLFNDSVTTKVYKYYDFHTVVNLKVEEYVMFSFDDIFIYLQNDKEEKVIKNRKRTLEKKLEKDFILLDPLIYKGIKVELTQIIEKDLIISYHFMDIDTIKMKKRDYDIFFRFK